MKTLFFITSIFQLLTFSAMSQNLTGHIHEKSADNEEIPLVGVNVYWLNTTIGTTTDADGYFTIVKPSKADHKLVVSFVGYATDTILVKNGKYHIMHTLKESQSLESVTITGSQKGAHFDRISPIQTQLITSTELKRAACCNLSESFETNASVDVSYSDAVTGAKQIQLLGLAGVYSQIQVENVPAVKGLASAFGLGYIPGSWMESIQVSKGTASVANGYESITGQVNVEFKKPQDSEKFHFNGYANSLGMTEFNSNLSFEVTPKTSTMVLAHIEKMGTQVDHNHDTFLDHPLIEQYHIFNRWKYQGENLESQVGVKVLSENRIAGQTTMHQEQFPTHFGIDAKNRRVDGFFKMGYIFDRPATTIGFIGSFLNHSQESIFGQKAFNAKQQSFTGNLIFLTYIGRTNHTIKTGVNLNVDNIDETLNSSSFAREEFVPGVYAEYSYKWKDDFTLMTGIRYDRHNLFGNMVTPRIHARYQIIPQLQLRASAGKGYRLPVVITENLHLLASSRQIIVNETIRLEEAWNYGINATQRYKVVGKELTISTDFYRTEFVNQLIVDLDSNPSEANLGNLKGKSYSNSFQVEVSYTPIERFDILAAYRLNNVKQTIAGQLEDKPLVSRYKGLLTMGYKTPLRKWQFDYTVQLNGGGRLPSTESLPMEFHLGETFPAYTTMNAQVTKLFRKWEAYVGVENITDFKQKHPIIDAGNPYGSNFDASMVWGPLTGRKIYVGFRLAILK